MMNDSHASAAGAAQNKRDKIQMWLAREWTVTELYDPNTAWVLQASSAGDRPDLAIVQMKEVPDLLLIQGSVAVDAEMQEALIAKTRDERQEILWKLRFGLLQLSVEFAGVNEQPETIMLRKSIYDDALTKDAFLHRVDEVCSAIVFVLWTLQRSLPGLTENLDSAEPFVN